MSLQLNTEHHAVLAQKADYRDGKPYEFHGPKDTRWHTCDRAQTLFNAGFTIIDILEDGKSDAEGNQQLLDRKSILSNYAKEHKLTQKPTNGKTATPEKKLDLNFEQQEALSAPMRNTQKVVNYVAQQIVRGNMPVDSVATMTQQFMDTLAALGVKPEQVQTAFNNAFNAKKQ